MVGIGIIRSTGEHSQEMEQLQDNMAKAEDRRRNLQDQLEHLQEKFEQYIVANHPHGAHADMTMTEARRPSVRNLLNSSSQPSSRFYPSMRSVTDRSTSSRNIG